MTYIYYKVRICKYQFLYYISESVKKVIIFKKSVYNKG